jgi:hypothetical protein
MLVRNYHELYVDKWAMSWHCLYQVTQCDIHIRPRIEGRRQRKCTYMSIASGWLKTVDICGPYWSSLFPSSLTLCLKPNRARCLWEGKSEERRSWFQRLPSYNDRPTQQQQPTYAFPFSIVPKRRGGKQNRVDRWKHWENNLLAERCLVLTF